MNSELEKRRATLAKRQAHLQRLAAQSRQRLGQMQACNQLREEHVLRWEQRQQELLAQVRTLETSSPEDEPRLLLMKAQRLEAEWEVHHRRVLLEATSVAGKREITFCERSCRVLRQILRQQEDLRTCERAMWELENPKDQIMTVLKVGLANLGMWLRDHSFGLSYQSCGWERLVPFFQLSGWVSTTPTEVRLEFAPFNHRELGRDLEDMCRKVNADTLRLPDGRTLAVHVGHRRRGHLDGPLANTG